MHACKIFGYCFQCQAPSWAETYAGMLRSTVITMQVASMHASGSYACKWLLCMQVAPMHARPQQSGLDLEMHIAVS